MKLHQLMARIAEQRTEYAGEIAELQAAGEPVQAEAEQVLLAELCGFIVDLESGALYPAGVQPVWVSELLREAAAERVVIYLPERVAA